MKTDWTAVLEWMHQNGASATKASTHFGIPVNSIRSHIKRAMMRGDDAAAKVVQNSEKVVQNPADVVQNAPQNAGKVVQNAPHQPENAPHSQQNAPHPGQNAPHPQQNAPHLTDAQMLGSEPLDPTPPVRATLNIKLPRAYVAERVSQIVPSGLLYRWVDSYVTVEPQPAAAPSQGKKRGTQHESSSPLRPMTDARFTTWIEQFIEWRQNAKENAAVTSISEQQARYILASDVMRTSTPEIREICPVRLPIATRNGKKWHFEPAPVGLDESTGIYTIDSVPINWARRYSIPEVLHGFERVFKDFPLDGRDESFSFGTSRSAAACVCAMLSQFLHHNIQKFPMILALANQSGTGKSFLTETILAPVHGKLQAVNYAEDEAEMRKTLNSLLFDGSMVCYLDDIKTLANNTINRFVTAGAIRDRTLGTNQAFTLQNRMQFFCTGNNLKTTPDIARRSLPIDLFWAGNAAQRQFTGAVLNEDTITEPAWRADMLSALWSLCKAWEDAGCPESCPNPPNSFKDFAACAHITMFAGLANPFGPRQIELDSGDTMGEALETLIIGIADSIDGYWSSIMNKKVHTGQSETFTVQQLIEKAEDMQILDIITNYAKEPKRSLGSSMRKVKGKEYVDSTGRKFRVGSKRTKASNNYQFTILSEPTASAPADSAGAHPED